jgi:hypothetical protein
LPRRKYIASSRKEHMRMIRKKSFYRDFDPKDYR